MRTPRECAIGKDASANEFWLRVAAIVWRARWAQFWHLCRRMSGIESVSACVPTETHVAPGRKSPTPSPQAHTTFEEVYRTHFHAVLRRLARLNVREADLLDVAQNVFVIVHRQLPRFEGRSSIATWLRAICQFVARDYVRSARLQREVIVDPGVFDKSANTNRYPFNGFGSPELAHIVTSTLNRITEKLRVVLVLSAADGLSGEEIANTLNIPVGTVRSRLRLARKALERTNGKRRRSRR